MTKLYLGDLPLADPGVEASIADFNATSFGGSAVLALAAGERSVETGAPTKEAWTPTLQDTTLELGRWQGQNFIPGDVGSFYISFEPGQNGGLNSRRVPFGDTLRNTVRDRKAGSSTISQNNGVCVIVDADDRMYLGRSSLVPRDNEESTGAYVPLSNGEAFADPRANEQAWQFYLMEYAKTRGIQIDSPDDPIVEDAEQYEPDLSTLAEQIESDKLTLTMHTNRLARFTAIHGSDDTTAISGILDEIEKKEGVEFDKSKSHHAILTEIIEAQQKVVETLQTSIDTATGFDAIGHHSIEISERDMQQLFDVGKFTVDEQNGVIRFVDTRGRYMEAPLTEDRIKTLKEKGYSQKYEEVDSDGRTRTGSEVIKPRLNGQLSERTNSSFVKDFLSTDDGPFKTMFKRQKPAFGVGTTRRPGGLAGGIVE